MVSKEKQDYSTYEGERTRRIQENLEKLKALGLPVRRPTNPKITHKPKPKRKPTPSMPRRTSSRLMKSGDEEKKKAGVEEKKEGEDYYTWEHEKLLGDCKVAWSEKDPKRVYDSDEGITCHQCRQKTLGPRTQCNFCRLPRGRFCGNCLYTRYGENLFEANENESWSCPMCRDICNCSLCQQNKGFPPTGPIHHKAWEMGFKSVAHYLILTRAGAGAAK